MLVCTWRAISAAEIARDSPRAASPGSVKSEEAGTAASTGSSTAGNDSDATRVIVQTCESKRRARGEEEEGGQRRRQRTWRRTWDSKDVRGTESRTLLSPGLTSQTVGQTAENQTLTSPLTNGIIVPL
jgi:hypothetical protein